MRKLIIVKEEKDEALAAIPTQPAVELEIVAEENRTGVLTFQLRIVHGPNMDATKFETLGHDIFQVIYSRLNHPSFNFNLVAPHLEAKVHVAKL